MPTPAMTARPARRSGRLRVAQALALGALAALALQAVVQPGRLPPSEPGVGPDVGPDVGPGVEAGPTVPAPPDLSLTLNGIPDDSNPLLVVPPHGFVVNVDWQAVDLPVDPARLSIVVSDWKGTVHLSTRDFEVDADGARLVTSARQALPEGSFEVQATVGDATGATRRSAFAFAVRDFERGVPPIGEGQQIWLDFEVDRDATPGPDFDVDLATLGLASSEASDALNATIRAWVIDEVLARVRAVYHDANPAGLDRPDPIAVRFSATDLDLPDTTRICVGGEDPSGGGTLGNVTFDPNNARRSSVECESIPPTGVFPREFLMYTGQTAFQSTIDPLRPAAGGTPVGAHPADARVLQPGFDPEAGGRSAGEVSRYLQVRRAVDAFGAALGTVLAHEAGHALGLVPEGPPGGGLYGGSSGSRYAHNEMPDRRPPGPAYLMDEGGSFTFAELAGLEGEPFAELRPLNHAYLRDRVVLAADVTALLPPPVLEAVDPPRVTQLVQSIRLTGVHFAATPSILLSNEHSVDRPIGEILVSDTEVTATIVKRQVLPGVYDVTLVNPDGQAATLPDALTIE